MRGHQAPRSQGALAGAGGTQQQQESRWEVKKNGPQRPCTELLTRSHRAWLWALGENERAKADSTVKYISRHLIFWKIQTIFFNRGKYSCPREYTSVMWKQ